MTVQIRKAADRDIPELMRLFRENTPAEKSADFFRWWNSFASVTFCAESDRGIAGMFVILRRKLANELNCGVLMGLIVEREWRGRGLFKAVGDEALGYYDDMDMFCCLTNVAGRKALENSFGFRAIGDIVTMIKPVNPFEVMGGEDEIRVCSAAPDTEFCNYAVKDENVLMFRADTDFRRWRFGRHPCRSYRIIQTGAGDFVVTNTYHDPATGRMCGDIADFEISVLEENRIGQLCESACSCLSREVGTVTIKAVPDSLLHRAALKAGFAESEDRHFFCLKVRDAKNDYLHNASSWLIKWGDFLR